MTKNDKTLDLFTTNKIIRICKFHWKTALIDLLGFIPKVYGFSPFRGCLHECVYCWVKVLLKRFPAMKPDGDFLNLELCINATERLKIELPKLSDTHLIIASNVSDLFQPIIETNNYLYERLKEWISLLHDYNVLFITKNGTLLKKLLHEFPLNPDKHIIGTTITTTSCNEERREKYEKNSSSTEDRICAIIEALNLNFKTFISIEPPLIHPRYIIAELASRGISKNTWIVVGAANYSISRLWSMKNYRQFYFEVRNARIDYGMNIFLKDELFKKLGYDKK